MIFSDGSRNDFIEGPCNCVNRLLKETCPEEVKGSFEIVNLVARKDFSLEIFNINSCMHLLCSTPARKIILPKRELSKCPRVGLTLKRYDEEKEKYWLADYRYLSFPAYNSKMKDFIVLSHLANKKLSIT